MSGGKRGKQRLSARQQIRERLAAEVGTLIKDAPYPVALAYPSPYHVGMSSLGMQTIYRELNQHEGVCAHRAFLPDDVATALAERQPWITYEAMRPVAHYPLVAFSVAYELELAGVIQCLQLAGIAPLAAERDVRDPFVLGGGPLTFSNPLPLAPFVDAILMGEADESIHVAVDILRRHPDKETACSALAAEIPSAYVPRLHGDQLPAGAKCSDAKLPAYAQIRTPHTELSNMFLIEAERGCSRRCQYCVMRRSTNGGMRLVDVEHLLSLVPADAPRVGLVGAAVSDHPRIAEIVERLAAAGKGVGLSSLRPDRLNDRFVAALKAGGYRTLTTASDGASQRLRDQMQRKALETHLLRAAQLARAHRMQRLKIYMMVGLPDETEADIDELVRFSTELSSIVPLSLGIAPFVAKRNTPLDGQPFAGIEVVERRLRRLRRGVRGRVDLRATSARWAYIEYLLAQGGQEEGQALVQALATGGRFADWQRALHAIQTPRPRRPLRVVA